MFEYIGDGSLVVGRNNKQVPLNILFMIVEFYKITILDSNMHICICGYIDSFGYYQVIIKLYF